MQTKIVFRTSMNPTPYQVYSSDLEDLFWTVNKDRRLSNLPEITHDDVIKITYKMTVYEYMNRYFCILTYHERFSIYDNNVRHAKM